MFNELYVDKNGIVSFSVLFYISIVLLMWNTIINYQLFNVINELGQK